MGFVKISKAAYFKLVLHAAKYSTTAISGLLLGSKTGEKVDVIDAIPLFHTSSPLSPLVEIALHQAEIYAQQTGKKIVGVYFANETVVDVSINPFVGRIAAKVDDLLGGGSVLLQIDNYKLVSANLAVKAFGFASGSWKALPPNHVSPEEDDMKASLKELVSNRSYIDLVDFENHLDDIEVDWLENSKLQKALDQSLDLGQVTPISEVTLAMSKRQTTLFKFLNQNGAKANKSAPSTSEAMELDSSPKKPSTEPSSSQASEKKSPLKRKAEEEILERDDDSAEKICPDYKGKELGLGESLLMKAIAEATGRDVSKIKSEVATVGDLGSVALVDP
ncbi:hypothetical protein BC829DRAFT_442189 [Chytridium lagenaria]|nr:hypothetical protein BC829DRAFT_442189 [Chytridium lagenaria]